jgi:hypothetical protein
MTKTSTASTSVIPSKISNRRLAREWKTVSAMVRIHCRDQHGGALCGDCQELMRYISLRLERCRFGKDKPTCAKCPVHCYQRDYRERIKTVMRYAGPRMLWEHPWLSLWHLLDCWLRGPVRTAEPAGSQCDASGPKVVASSPRRPAAQASETACCE